MDKLEIKVWCGGRCAGPKAKIIKNLPANCNDRCPDCGYTLIKQNTKVSMKVQARTRRPQANEKEYLAGA